VQNSSVTMEADKKRREEKQTGFYINIFILKRGKK